MSWVLAAVTLIPAIAAAAGTNHFWIQTSFPTNQNIRGMRSTPVGLYVSTRSNGVYFTSDKGSTWSNLNAGLTNLFAGTFGVASNGTLVVGIGNVPGYGAWFLTNNTWQRATGLANTTAPGLGVQAIIRDRNGHLLASYDWGGRLHRSTDGGLSFTQLPTLVPDSAFTLLLGPDGTLYAGTETGGAFYSTNDAVSWSYLPGSARNDGYTNGNINALVVNNAGELVGNLKGDAVGQSHSGIARLVGGFNGTWVDATGFPGPMTVVDLARAPDGTLFSCNRRTAAYPQTYARVTISTNGGAAWNAFTNGLGLPTSGSSARLELDRDGYLYYGTTDVGLFRTVEPVYEARPALSSAAGGTVLFSLMGTPNLPYRIESTTNVANLNSPFAWSTIGVVTAGVSGTFTFTNTPSPTEGARVYRAVFP